MARESHISHSSCEVYGILTHLMLSYKFPVKSLMFQASTMVGQLEQPIGAFSQSGHYSHWPANFIDLQCQDGVYSTDRHLDEGICIALVLPLLPLASTQSLQYCLLTPLLQLCPRGV